jgi:putative sigma-54 modulation protein
MKLEFTGRHMDIPEAARNLAERKLARIARLLTGATRAHIVVSAEGHRRIVEITVYSKRLTLSALEQSNDIVLSLATAVEKLGRQVEKYRGRLESRRKSAEARGTTARRRPAAKVEDALPRPSVRRRTVVAPAMTLGRAMASVEEGENMVLFRDSETDRLSVLYRRKDGKVGLVEPE